MNTYKDLVCELCDYLESIGLLVDDGYKFGTGWLKRDIPVEDVAVIGKLLTEE